jgi:uncharacterized protein (DUF4415 family)
MHGKFASMKSRKKPKPKSRLIYPTPEEDEQINAGIAADPDARELTEADFKRMRPASEVHPELVEAYRRSRGKQKAPTKIATSIRLSETVLEAYKKSGPGWQARIDQDLQDLVAKRRGKKQPRKQKTG